MPHGSSTGEEVSAERKAPAHMRKNKSREGAAGLSPAETEVHVGAGLQPARHVKSRSRQRPVTFFTCTETAPTVSSQTPRSGAFTYSKSWSSIDVRVT